MSGSSMKFIVEQILATDQDVSLAVIVDNQDNTMFSKRRSELDTVFTEGDEPQLLQELQSMFKTWNDILPKAGKISFLMSRREKFQVMYFFTDSFTIAILSEITVGFKKMAEIADKIEKDILPQIKK